ncbi:MAG: NADH-quinone oxidoreductase subunit A [bacterium]|nr:NADH-quinone oxidoreductase subunit A [bacterium]
MVLSGERAIGRHFLGWGRAVLREYLPIFILVGIAASFAVVSLAVSFMMGRRKPTVQKGMAYECGIVSETSAHGRFSVKFFLVAMLFIVFDVEAIFLFPWAVSFREMGTYGFFVILPFMALLVASLAYEWKRGALEWD